MPAGGGEDHRHVDLEEYIGKIKAAVSDLSTGVPNTFYVSNPLPVSAKGDLITHDGAGEVRLPVPASTAYVITPTGSASTYGIGWTDATILQTTGTTTGTSYAITKNSSTLWGLSEAVTVATTGTAIGNYYVLLKSVDGWSLVQLTTTLIDGL